MTEQKINPSSVTKPIQLLAAWLVGLIAINGSFLAAASYITRPDGASGVLVIAAILDVPIFLACLFMLQTKFRPEMQEDEFYWRYLERRYSTETAKTEVIEIAKRSDKILEFEPVRTPTGFRRQRSIPSDTEIHINDLLPTYQSLLGDLLQAGYKIYDTFGTSSRGKTVPSPFIIAVSDGAAIEQIRDVIRISLRHGLEGIAHAVEPEWPNRIYIGAYSYEAKPYVPIDPKIEEQLLSPELDWDQLLQIFSRAGRHAVSSSISSIDTSAASLPS